MLSTTDTSSFTVVSIDFTGEYREAFGLLVSASLSVVKPSIARAIIARIKQAIANGFTPLSSQSSSSVADNLPVDKGAEAAPGKLGALGELGCNFTVA